MTTKLRNIEWTVDLVRQRLPTVQVTTPSGVVTGFVRFRKGPLATVVYKQHKKEHRLQVAWYVIAKCVNTKTPVQGFVDT